MSNVYYNPEDFGLTVVGEAGYNGYEFDIFVVYKDDEGNLYFGSDSGCSCYSPFEDVTSKDELTQASKAEVLKHLDQWNDGRDDNLKSLKEKLILL